MPGNDDLSRRNVRIRSTPVPSGTPASVKSRSNLCARGELQSGGYVAGPLQYVTVDHEKPAHEAGRVGMVFHQQDSQRFSLRGGAGSFSGRTPAIIGSLTTKVAQRSFPSLCAVITPPCMSTIDLQLASPSPALRV